MKDRRLLISIHDRCQYRCHFCVYLQGTPSAKLGTEQWLSILEQAKASGFQTLEIGGRGEPTLSSDFIRIVSEAHDLGYKIELLSNAQNYRAILAVLPRISLLTINLNTVNENDFEKIHAPAGDISFQQCVRNIRKIISYISESNLDVGLKINYVVFGPSVLSAPAFPELVNRMFAVELGRQRRIYVCFQHMHNYVRGRGTLGIDINRLSKYLLFFKAFGPNEYLYRYSNVSEFLEKTRQMAEQLGGMKGRQGKPGKKEGASRRKAEKTRYVCDVYKKVLFVDNNGDLYGCFNPFRVANGLPIREDPFYCGNVVSQDLRQAVCRQLRPAPIIDVSRPYWQACLLCKAKPFNASSGKVSEK